MAKKNEVYIDIIIDDKGTTKRVAVDAGKLGLELDKTANASDKSRKNTDKLSKSNKNLDRNMRGTAKMSGNQTKEFSKMSQGMGGLVGAYATLAAQVFAVSAAFQFLQSASNMRNLIAGQEAMGAVTGRTYKTMTQSIIAATDAQLKYADAAKAVAIGTAAGLSTSQLTDLGTAAKNASFALGRDLTDSFNRLIRGVTKAEPELLDELGIILRLERATEKYAQKLDVTRDSLNAYQRTQAVTIEVQEQVAQKFGAIEMLMDKDAAALAQFTKSFDELSNTIKVGLINGLTPGLKFLSENTMALVASLTLLAIPIVKAIIPSMDGWIERSEKLARVQRIAAIKRAKQQKEEIKMMERVGKTNKELLVTQQAETQATALDRFGGGKQGSGLGFLTGQTEGPRGQVEARKLLDDAQNQFDEHGEIRKGKMQQWSKEEVQQAEDTYQQKVQTVEQGEDKVNKEREHGHENRRKKEGKMARGWRKTTEGMVKWAGKAAVGINVAFTAIAIFGILQLAYEGLKKLHDYLNPLTEKQKREAETVKSLAETYKLLNEELERNANARGSILAGGDVLSNIGQSVQGADVPALMKKLDIYQGMNTEAKESPEGKNTLFRLQATLGFLVDMDKRYKDLRDTFAKNELVAPLTAQMAKITDELIHTGMEQENYAKKHDSFTEKLTTFQAGTKATIIQQMSDEADTFYTDIVAINNKAQEQMGLDTLTTWKLIQNDKLDSNRKTIEKLRKQDRILSAAELTSMAPYAGAGAEVINNKLDANDKKAEARQKVINVYLKSNKEILASTGFIERKNFETKAQALKLAQSKQGDREADEEKALAVKEAFNEAFKVERTIMEDLAKKRTKAKNIMGLGLTIQSKINNLAIKRVDAEEKLQLQIQEKKNAQLQYDQAVEGSARQQQALSILDTHKELTAEAREQFRITMDNINLDNSRLLVAQDNLSVLREQTALMVKQGIVTREMALLEAQSGGSIASRGAIRSSKGQTLLNEQTEASLADTTIQAKYQSELKSMREDAKGKPRKAGQTEEQQDLDIITQADQKTGASVSAQRLLNANNALAVHNAINASILDTNQEKIEGLQHDADSAGLLGKAKILADLKRAAILENPLWVETEENNKLMDIQATKMQELITLADQKQRLADAIQGGMEDAFMSIIDGSKNAKEAFADMARSILAAIARMIVEALVLKMLQSAMPGLFGAKGGTTPPVDYTTSMSGGMAGMQYAKKGGMYGPAYAKGGYGLNKNNFSRGGNARGPNAGYAATLHGNEAVVPLPDNKSIPVTLNGAGGTNNNVTVNVSMDSSGNTQQNSKQDGAQAGKLGNMVANAVQQELQFQKRSGGILNPYGVA